MATYFLDSSVIVKFYHAEPGSEEVIRLLSEPNSRFFIAPLAVVEVQRAFIGKLRAQLISLDELSELRKGLYQDISQRLLWVRRVHQDHFHTAARLVNTYSPTLDVPMLRSLDAVQLATALDVQRRSGLDYFVSTDKDLCTIAELEQLTVINPTA